MAHIRRQDTAATSAPECNAAHLLAVRALHLSRAASHPDLTSELSYHILSYHMPVPFARSIRLYLPPHTICMLYHLHVPAFRSCCGRASPPEAGCTLTTTRPSVGLERPSTVGWKSKDGPI